MVGLADEGTLRKLCSRRQPAEFEEKRRKWRKMCPALAPGTLYPAANEPIRLDLQFRLL